MFDRLTDRGAVEGNSRGSRGGERSEPTRDPRNQPATTHRPRSGRTVFREGSNSETSGGGLEGLQPAGGIRTTRRARCRLRRALSLGLKMRPLRGRGVTAGGSAGHARARCTRPRATHGYFIDRSAVADKGVAYQRAPKTLRSRRFELVRSTRAAVPSGWR